MGSEKFDCSTSGFLINQWFHLAVTFYQGNVNFYTNGNQTGNSTGFSFNHVIRNSNLFAKSNWPWDGPVNLTLDEIKIYNRPLSWTEVNIEMNKPQPITISIN